MDSKNLLLAAALSGLALIANASDTGATPKSANKDVEGQCSGINSCKGTSACHSEKNSCAGTNACKGKGWLKTSQKDCKDKKGTFKKA
ncbi:MAG: hypothetical protein Q7U04_04170 [Bacteriovorax sp.]|nr:hypothetical protein [Bacteriovorax sp.]